jgi:hypothetical protein
MSDMADINAVSMATVYINMVNINGQIHQIGKNGLLYLPDAPNTPVVDLGGTALTLAKMAQNGADLGKTFKDVSWRTPFGAKIQFPSSAKNVLGALRMVSPLVNTIRVDFNAATLGNRHYLATFKEFTTAAADLGYQLIIQYSDGAMAGAASEKGRVKTSDPSGRMHAIGTEWRRVLAWFEAPEQAQLLTAVYGWELINEPMAYADSPEGGRSYAKDIAAVYHDFGIDWHGRKILVGGLRASAQFRNVDVETIRAAIGDRLVWSVHAYPDWVNAKEAQIDDREFASNMLARLGPVIGDDILVSEAHLGAEDANGNAVPDLLEFSASGAAAASFNAARNGDWFAKQGIGWTYWPPVGRGNSFLFNAGKGKLDIRVEQLAFANDIWSTDEQGHGDMASDQELVARALEPGIVKTPLAMAYGYGGDDSVLGQSDRINMIYGGPGDDLIRGGGLGDYLFGQGGDDRLLGLAGDDILLGGSGDNHLDGGEGNDWLEAGTGRNILSGGDGDDVFLAGAGAQISTGEGADIIVPGAADTEGRALVISDLGPQDRIDLSGLTTSGSKHPVELRIADISIIGGGGGLRIWEQRSGIDIILTEGSLSGFRGDETFIGSPKGVSLVRFSPDQLQFQFDPGTLEVYPSIK